MDSKKSGEIVSELLENEEVAFTYDNHYIYIQEGCEGGYDGSIYASKEDYENEVDCLDGGVCETIVAIIAVEFFTDISRNLTERGL